MTLGERLLAKRKESGLSQQAVADKLDVNQTTVSEWERGKSVPRVDQAIALAKLLNVDLVWLVDAPAAEVA